MGDFNLKLVISAIDKISAPARKMGKAIGAISKRTGLDKVGKALGSVGRQLGKVGKEAVDFGAKLTAAAAAAGAAMFALVKKTADAADSSVKVADKLGISIEQLQRMRHAAELNGIAYGTLDMSLQRFIRRSAEAAAGTGEAKDALKAMGIKLKDTDGKLRPAADLLLDVAGAYQKIEDSAKRVLVSQKLFDSEGVDMVRMLGQGKTAMQAMYDEADKLGIITEAQARKSEAFNDNLFRLMTTLKRLAQGIAFELMPEADNFLVYIQKLTIAARPKILAGLKTGFHEIGVVIRWVKARWDSLTQHMSAFNQAVLLGLPVIGTLISRMMSFAEGVGKARFVTSFLATVLGFKLLRSVFGLIMPLYQLGKALLLVTLRAANLAVGIIGGLMKAMYAALPALWGMVTAVGAFTAALLANPITWVVALLAGLVAAGYLLIKNWDKIAAWMRDMWEGIKTSAMDSINGLIDWLLGLDMVTVGSKWIGGLIDTITDKWEAFTGWFVEKANVVAGFFGGGSTATVNHGFAPAAPSAFAHNDNQKIGGRVKVEFANMPQGTRVVQQREQGAGGLDIDAGYAMGGF